MGSKDGSWLSWVDRSGLGKSAGETSETRFGCGDSGY